MSEKLLPCPFCGGEPSTFEYDGVNQATCRGKHIDCAGTDVVAPVAMWNRRTPAAEGEAVAWVNQTTLNAIKERPKEAAWVWGLPNGSINIPLYASPVVPVGVSREEIAEILKDEVLTDGGIIMSSEPSSRRRLRIADRILAALRPTDTGRE
jgi:hypothetical protein